MRGRYCTFRLLMMGGVSPETCWASYKYEIKFWYTVTSCWIFYMNYEWVVRKDLKNEDTKVIILVLNLSGAFPLVGTQLWTSLSIVWWRIRVLQCKSISILRYVLKWLQNGTESLQRKPFRCHVQAAFKYSVSTKTGLFDSDKDMTSSVITGNSVAC